MPPLEEPAPPDEEAIRRGQILARRVIHAGWVCVLLSAVFLYLSKAVDPGVQGDDSFWWAIHLMAARLCGMGSFAIGGVAIYNHRWTEGVLMLLLSVGLPVVAYITHGTI